MDLSPQIDCNGTDACPAAMHVHGCFTPHRAEQCDVPGEHGHTAGALDEGGSTVSRPDVDALMADLRRNLRLYADPAADLIARSLAALTAERARADQAVPREQYDRQLGRLADDSRRHLTRARAAEQEAAAQRARADQAEREWDEWENEAAGQMHPSWDGDESQISILTNFIRHAARLDSAIEDAREADGWSGKPLAFVWNDDDRTLSSVPAPPEGPAVLAATVRKIAATLTSPAQIHTLLYAADRIADQEASA
jgi:hypothetical protein